MQQKDNSRTHTLTAAAQLRTIRNLTARPTHETVAVEVCAVILDRDRQRELLVLENGNIMVCKRKRHDGAWTGPRAGRPR